MKAKYFDTHLILGFDRKYLYAVVDVQCGKMGARRLDKGRGHEPFTFHSFPDQEWNHCILSGLNLQNIALEK